MPQSPLVLRPPELQPSALLRPAQVGGSTIPPWVLLTRTDQGSSPFDPGVLSGAGTVFDSTTGQFTWVIPGDTTIIDGFRENMVRWTVLVTDLYPDWNPVTDTIDVAMTNISIPNPSVAGIRYGLAVGILNAQTSGLATAAGRMIGVAQLNPTLTTFNSYSVSASSWNASTVLPGIVCPNRIVSSWWNTIPSPPSAAGALQAAWEIHQPNGNRQDGPSISSTPIAPASTATSERIHIGHLHIGSVAEAVTMVCNVWHRRIRTAGTTGLP